MILLALATAATLSPPATSVVDAERAFAARAQAVGQWTAFRETAAPDAILFWPKPTNAHAALKGLNDPAKSVRWWPTKAWQSCDGMLAVTTGGALWPDGRHGWFTTVWRKQPDGGWKWVLDHGDFLDTPRPEPRTVVIEKPAACRKVVLTTPVSMGPPTEGYRRQEFASADGTLVATFSTGPGWRTVVTRMENRTPDNVVLVDDVKLSAK